MWNKVEQALEGVRKYVDRHQPNNYRLVVNDDPHQIRTEEGWWYVVVRPDRDGVYSHEYAERLSDIEDEIWEKEQIRVLLIPTLAN